MSRYYKRNEPFKSRSVELNNTQFIRKFEVPLFYTREPLPTTKTGICVYPLQNRHHTLSLN